jgi:UPF0755 protein
MKKIAFALAAAVLLGTALLLTWARISSPPGTGMVSEFTLERGWGVRKVAAALEDSGLVRSRFVVLWRYRRAFAPAPLQAGKYLLSDTMLVDRILGIFTRGEVIPVPTHWVTIPPGVRLEEGIGLLADQTGRPAGDFLNVAKDSVFLAEHAIPGLEGYLYPETYEFADSLDCREILSRIVATGFRVMTPGWRDSCAALGLTPEQGVILASIVEREGMADSERPLIAGVFLGRLRRGMRLESCATVQYALGEVHSRLLYRDLEVQSPYNTYLHPGLPPTAICSPGTASLRAVAMPDTSSGYLFFVSREDGSGLHLFARTAAEHGRNIESVR